MYKKTNFTKAFFFFFKKTFLNISKYLCSFLIYFPTNLMVLRKLLWSVADKMH